MFCFAPDPWHHAIKCSSPKYLAQIAEHPFGGWQAPTQWEEGGVPGFGGALGIVAGGELWLPGRDWDQATQYPVHVLAALALAANTGCDAMIGTSRAVSGDSASAIFSLRTAEPGLG